MRAICKALNAARKRKPAGRLIIILVLFTVSADGFAGENGGHKRPAPDGISLLDAVVTTIEKQSDIALREQDVEFSRGRLLEARGQFDATLGISAGHDHEETPLSLADRLGLGIADITTDTTSSRVDLAKQFRTGISILPSFTITRIDTSPSSVQPTNSSQVNFLVVLPLLKGRGTEATAANEMSAEVDYGIRLLDLQHAVSQNVRNAMLVYWTYLAEKRKLDQLVMSEARALRLAKDVRTVIDADEMPASELEPVKANLADKSALRIAGEQRLVDARQVLGLVMGIEAQEIRSLRLPADDFPQVDLDEVNELVLKTDSLVERALRQRSDLHAARKRQESTNILFKGARNNLLPKLNMEVKVGYSGLDEGHESRHYLQSLADNVPGVSASLSLRYEWPFSNNSARGLLAQRAALHQQAVIQTDALAINISSGVMVAVSALRNSTMELAKARESVSAYRTAVQNEGRKMRLGMATLLDLIDVEDRLTNALITEISAQLKFAAALSNLRFETGTLLVLEDEKFSVDKSQLTALPFPAGR